MIDTIMKIENSGAFPPDMTMEKLLGGHKSEPQNLIIANVLYKSEILESWGRGIKLMIDECRRVNLPDPEFHSDGSTVWVIFKYTRRAKLGNQAPNKYHPSTTQVPPKYHPSTTQVDIIIRTIGQGIYSVGEIMDILQLKNRRYFTKYYLKPAVEQEWIEPLYPNQPKHPRQKYRLTEKGKAWLKDNCKIEEKEY